MKHVAAFTEQYSESYPGYISINAYEDNTCSIIVRQRGGTGNEVSRLAISREDLLELAEQIKINYLQIPRSYFIMMFSTFYRPGDICLTRQRIW